MSSSSAQGCLRSAIRHANRRRSLVSLLLIAPLIAYIIVFFVVPIGLMLYRAVDNPEISAALPRTVKALSASTEGQGAGVPSELVFEALGRDLSDSRNNKAIGEAARRLNYEGSGYRTLIMKTARRLSSEASDASQTEGTASGVVHADDNRGLPSSREKFIGIDARWGQAETWNAIRRAAPTYTPYYILTALDLQIDHEGNIAKVPADQRVYLDILVRTISIAFVVTLSCLLIGYPLAALMVKASPGFRFVLLLAVMLPFWTSLLARTTAWIVVLQKEGLVNELLQSLRLINEPLTLIFNSTGLYIVMVHILLPFTVLPIFSSMKGIAPHFMRASASLGAHPIKGFMTVYLPMTMPGVGAGGLLTFIVAAGYYVTPSLVASAREQMLGYFIAFYANTTINWGMASALGLILLTCVMGIYLIAARTVGIRQIAGLR